MAERGQSRSKRSKQLEKLIGIDRRAFAAAPRRHGSRLMGGPESMFTAAGNCFAPGPNAQS